MRKGSIVAKVLTLLLAVGMLSQNIVTVYADDEGDNPPSKITITYEVASDCADMGSVTLDKEEVSSVDSIQGSTAEVKDADQYEFLGWNRDENNNYSSTEATLKLTTLPSENVTYTAYFGEKEEPVTPDQIITISYAVDPVDAGSVTNDKDTQTNGEGSIGGSTASANEGYQFVGWKDEDGNTVCESDAFTPSAWPTEDVTYTAYFEAVAVTTSGDVVKTNDELVAAVTAAQSGDTIYLGAGKFTLYNMGAQTKGKSLTFVGQGASTEWGIGATVPDPNKFGTEYNGDYSFDGAGTITFKDMTLQSGTADYLGFIRADNTVVEKCTINGKTFYWGYTSATFKDTTFNAPSGDYAMWTYSSPTMTFDGCTFNASGKVINVYTDYSAGKQNITINYANCTVDSTSSNKTVLNINDSNMGSCKYIINISGKNTVNGITTEDLTCSKLFGYGGKFMAYWRGSNSGRTDVSIDGTTVWTKGKMVDHEIDCTNDKYTDGYKDNAYTIKYGKWMTDPATGLTVREITKTCNYCGWSSKTNESQTTDKDLPGDLLINGDTEHDAVYSVKPGQVVSLTGALQVSEIADQMESIETVFKNPDGSSITLSDLTYGFSATLTVPDGMTLPERVTVTPDGLADTFTTDAGTVSTDGKSVTVEFSLTDEAKNAIKTYADLKSYVKAAGADTNGWLKVTIPDVKIDSDVADGTQLTVTGTVSGSFAATAKGTVRTFRFPYTWSGKQWADGKDAAATNDAIQLTVKVVAAKTNIYGSITWDDADNKDGIRPDTVVIHVYSVDADGTKTEVGKVTTADGTFSFQNLPVYDASGNKITYVVSEDAIDEYTVTINGDAENGFTIVNKHVPADAVVVSDPPVRKVVKGDKPAEAGTFTFTLKANKDGDPLPDKTEVTIKTADSGEAEFGDIAFAEEGTYSYTIRETEGNLDGYTYDDAAYVVTYKVTRASGTQATLTVDRTITKDGAKIEGAYVTFTNTYEIPKTPGRNDSSDGGNSSDNRRSDSSRGGSKSSDRTVTPAQTTPAQSIVEAGEAATQDVAPVATQPVTSIEESGAISTDDATISTGDDSMIALYGVLFVAAAASLVIWAKRTRVM